MKLITVSRTHRYIIMLLCIMLSSHFGITWGGGGGRGASIPMILYVSNWRRPTQD